MVVLMRKTFLFLFCLVTCKSHKDNAVKLNNCTLTSKSFETDKNGEHKLENAVYKKHEISSKRVLYEDKPDNGTNKIEQMPLAERILRQSVRFSDADKKDIVRLHNLYRSNVTPPAGNMEWMTWDRKLEEMAQIWSSKCVWKHGNPDSPKHYKSTGQNLYMGTLNSYSIAFNMWYEEFKDYDFSSAYCPPSIMCGHYTAMVWATSNKIGCGVSLCTGNQYYIVCNYYPPTNFIGEKPYKVGTPCSMCVTKDGGLCYDNICMKKEDCQQERLQCSCNLQCYNGGVLDRSKCRCSCKDGWEGIDCSVVCRDADHHCHKNPGFPNANSCSLNNGKVGSVFCRKMCGNCKAVGTDLSNTYCEGKTCDPGYVLNDACYCTLLCPGPKCGSSALGFNILLPVMTVAITYGLKLKCGV